MNKLAQTVVEIDAMKRDGTLWSALAVVGAFVWAGNKAKGPAGALLGAAVGVGLTMVPFGGGPR